MNRRERKQLIERIHRSALLDYETTMRTARAMPLKTFMKYADGLYADAHIADQTRREAARRLTEG